MSAFPPIVPSSERNLMAEKLYTVFDFKIFLLKEKFNLS